MVMQFEKAQKSFIDHLQIERGLSPNSIAAYGRDLERFASYLIGQKLDFQTLQKHSTLELPQALILNDQLLDTEETDPVPANTAQDEQQLTRQHTSDSPEINAKSPNDTPTNSVFDLSKISITSPSGFFPRRRL